MRHRSFRVDALDILAANARFFPPEKKGQLMTVLARARITEDNNPLIFATIYGRLALAGPATEEMPVGAHSPALASHPLSANRRRLEADLAIEALLELSPAQRDAIWTALQKLITQIEPEIRIELAHLLIQMRRLEPINQAGLGSVN